MKAAQETRHPSFEYVVSEIRKRTFGILSTVSSKNWPLSTGVLYGVSPPGEPFSIYVLSKSTTKKVKNLRHNPQAAFVIPFPHHLLRFIPDATVRFQATVEILPVTDSVAQKAYSSHRILRMTLKQALEEGSSVFLKLKPKKRLRCYGLGISLGIMKKNVAAGNYSVTIPVC